MNQNRHIQLLKRDITIYVPNIFNLVDIDLKISDQKTCNQSKYCNDKGTITSTWTIIIFVKWLNRKTKKNCRNKYLPYLLETILKNVAFIKKSTSNFEYNWTNLYVGKRRKIFHFHTRQLVFFSLVFYYMQEEKNFIRSIITPEAYTKQHYAFYFFWERYRTMKLFFLGKNREKKYNWLIYAQNERHLQKFETNWWRARRKYWFIIKIRAKSFLTLTFIHWL